MVKKEIISLILTVFLIGIVSAQISIFPSSVEINAYPGETYSVNLTITSDGRYAVFFNSTNPNINITPQYIITNNDVQNETINLTFAKDISLGTVSFDVFGSSEIVEVHVPSSSESGGSCGDRRIIYRDRNNTIYVPQNITCPKNESVPPEITSKKSNLNWVITTLFILAVFLTIFIIIKIKKKNKN